MHINDLDEWHWKKLLSMGILHANECCEGVICVTDGKKWGAMTFEGNPIIPIVYDFVEIDEYEYGSLWIVCGKNGYHYKKWQDKGVYYQGEYDIYDFSGNLITEGAKSYDNGNHQIAEIMHQDFDKLS